MADLKNAAMAKRFIIGVSVAVFLLVCVLYALPKADHIPEFAKSLPLLNACINGSCFLILLLSLWFIKNKNVQMHQRLNTLAMALSAVFLISYVVFHSYGVETKYPADAPYRSLYLFVLLTHIVLAAIVLPLILFSFYRGLTGDIVGHKKIVKYSFPVWIYVTLSGVIVYIMISPYYQF